MIKPSERVTNEDLSSVTSRTFCSVLNDMRNAVKTMNFSYIGGLIEELQSLGDRMEDALYGYKSAIDADDIKRLRKERDELKKEVRELMGKKQKLIQKVK